MAGERIEIRTPQEHLLLCELVKRNGVYYVEVKARSKYDQFELDTLIHTLLDYKNKIHIAQQCNYASYSER